MKLFLALLLSSGATLKLFGSSVNGFGFRQSDMDICMTFDGDTFSVSFSAH